jgi:hypothetical protein
LTISSFDGALAAGSMKKLVSEAAAWSIEPHQPRDSLSEFVDGCERRSRDVPGFDKCLRTKKNLNDVNDRMPVLFIRMQGTSDRKGLESCCFCALVIDEFGFTLKIHRNIKHLLKTTKSNNFYVQLSLAPATCASASSDTIAASRNLLISKT